jgi:PhnB protein
MQVQPYVFFDGRCDEAIAFYQKAVGAKSQMLIRYKDSPDTSNMPPGSAEKIMHATLIIGESAVHVSDGHCGGSPKFEGFSLSLTLSTIAEASRYFNALAEGGQILVPLSKTFFSPSFGMVSDRFGVMWMVYVKAA